MLFQWDCKIEKYEEIKICFGNLWLVGPSIKIDGEIAVHIFGFSLDLVEIFDMENCAKIR